MRAAHGVTSLGWRNHRHVRQFFNSGTVCSRKTALNRGAGGPSLLKGRGIMTRHVIIGGCSRFKRCRSYIVILRSGVLFGHPRPTVGRHGRDNVVETRVLGVHFFLNKSFEERGQKSSHIDFVRCCHAVVSVQRQVMAARTHACVLSKLIWSQSVCPWL